MITPSSDGATPPPIRQLSASELDAMRRSGTPIELVDVRTMQEREIAAIDGSRLLDQAYHDELLQRDREAPLVFQCHHGVRSQHAAEYFQQHGFTNLYNLAGGIDAWSLLVDPSVPRYQGGQRRHLRVDGDRMDAIPLLVEFATPSSLARERHRTSDLPIVGNGPPGTFVLFPDGLRISLPTDQIVFADDADERTRVGFGGMQYVGPDAGSLVFARVREVLPDDQLSPARSHTMRLDMQRLARVFVDGRVVWSRAR